MFLSFKKLFYFIIFCIFASYSVTTRAQELPFPYDVHIETIAGNCYDDSRVIITLWDGFGNEVVIDPSTQSAVNTTDYPLYNVQYYYRNLSAGSNTRYDTLNDIRMSAGTYCIGVAGNVRVTSGGTTDYVEVDTIICNVVVPTNYTHLEASVLIGIADNNNGDRER